METAPQGRNDRDMYQEGAECIADAAGAQDKLIAAPLIQPPAPAVKEEPNQTTLQPSIKAVR